jgi:hypothetical protein
MYSLTRTLLVVIADQSQAELGEVCGLRSCWVRDCLPVSPARRLGCCRTECCRASQGRVHRCKVRSVSEKYMPACCGRWHMQQQHVSITCPAGDNSEASQTGQGHIAIGQGLLVPAVCSSWQDTSRLVRTTLPAGRTPCPSVFADLIHTSTVTALAQQEEEHGMALAPSASDLR